MKMSLLFFFCISLFSCSPSNEKLKNSSNFKEIETIVGDIETIKVLTVSNSDIFHNHIYTIVTHNQTGMYYCMLRNTHLGYSINVNVKYCLAIQKEIEDSSSK